MIQFTSRQVEYYRRRVQQDDSVMSWLQKQVSPLIGNGVTVPEKGIATWPLFYFCPKHSVQLTFNINGLLQDGFWFEGSIGYLLFALESFLAYEKFSYHTRYRLNHSGFPEMLKFPFKIIPISSIYWSSIALSVESMIITTVWEFPTWRLGNESPLIWEKYR